MGAAPKFPSEYRDPSDGHSTSPIDGEIPGEESRNRRESPHTPVLEQAPLGDAALAAPEPAAPDGPPSAAASDATSPASAALDARLAARSISCDSSASAFGLRRLDSPIALPLADQPSSPRRRATFDRSGPNFKRLSSRSRFG